MRREETGEKYIKLGGILLLILISTLALIFGLIYGLRFFAGLFDKMPGTTYVFTLFILLVPALILITTEIIFIRRTRNFPARGAKVISYIILGGLVAYWAYPLFADFRTFFTQYRTSINYYRSYDLAWLSANVFGIFLAAIIQAQSLPKRKEWWEREA